MGSRLRVLVLSSEPPYPPTHGGARLKLYRVLQHLAPRHDLTLLSLLEFPAEREHLAALQRVAGTVRLLDRPAANAPATWRDRWRAPFYKLAYTPEMAALIERELATQPYDLVHVDMAHMAVYTPLLRRHRKIIAAHDSQTVSYASRLPLAKTAREKLRARYRLALVRGYERRFYAKYNAAVVVAEEDRAMLRQLCPRLAVEIIPNGIDLEQFQPGDPAAEVADRLIFTGTMDFAPNVDAAGWFAKEILPRIAQTRPHVTLEIVGRNPAPAVLALANGTRVTVTGFVPDLTPHLAQAAVYVCPLRLGSGMKNKTLEAMAMGKAIVTTAEGASGIGAQAGREYIIADNAAEFADAVVHLLADAPRRQQLGKAARAFAETHYSWQRTGKLFDELYQRVAAS